MIDMALFVIVHERVGFCFGLAVGFFTSGLAVWIASLVGGQ